MAYTTIISLVALLVSLQVGWRIAKHIFFPRLKGLRGPSSPSFIFGNLYQLAKSRCGLSASWEDKFGHAYRINGGFGKRILVLSDPKGISHILNSHHSNYPRAPNDKAILQLAFGTSVFTAVGEAHKSHRKALAPAFTAKAVAKVSDVIFDLDHRLTDQWNDQLQTLPAPTMTVDAVTCLHDLTLDALSMTTFAYSISQSSGPIGGLLTDITKMDITRPILFLTIMAEHFPAIWSLPNPMTEKWNRLRAALAEVAEDVWKAGVPEKGAHAQILELLGKANVDVAVSEITGLIFAGSETAGNSIGQCLHQLSLHTEIQSKLRNELIDWMSRTGSDLTQKAISNPSELPYLDAVVRECLRYASPAIEILRTTAKDDIIPLEYPLTLRDGSKITSLPVKAGQSIIVPVREGINLNKDVWGEDAKEFNPNRWLASAEEKSEAGIVRTPPGEPTKIRAPGNLMTFGDGPRICVGRLFAVNEVKIILSVLLTNFTFSPPPSAEDQIIDYYPFGPIVKPIVRGKEEEGPRMPLTISAI